MPPAAHQGPSHAPYVEWATPNRPIDRPIALFVDAPGGPMDTLAANFDVTTFLNDRFYPVFQVSLSESYVRFYDAKGCALTPPLTPTHPQAWIDSGNAVMREMLQSNCKELFHWNTLQDLEETFLHR